jgi:dihydrofolate synthase/folylpolyglutamate synthase
MNYQQTIEYLFASLPMFQRIGDAAVKKDLTNIRLLCEMLGNPHHDFPTIHIAGTNGKGSTSHMLASIFQAAGRQVGLYTSPHYVDFRERIKINGTVISEREVVAFVKKYRYAWKDIQPSFFEITVAMAFDHFRNKKVDIAIIETGLGGRLDSTNIITPMMSVITNISFDHTSMLGNTLPEIAYEKAGIIKSGIPVIIGEWKRDTYQVFRQKAKSEKAPVYFASKISTMMKEENRRGINYLYHSTSLGRQLKLKSDLQGPYQSKNLRTVVTSCLIWNKHYPDEALKMDDIRCGLKNVIASTDMIGRWMVLRERPTVITDAAHNFDGIKNIIPALVKFHAKQRHFVLGFVSDKDVRQILNLFPRKAIYYWCMPDIPRGKPADQSRQDGEKLGLRGLSYPSVLQAYNAAIKNAGEDDLIFVGGSSYVVGNFLKDIKR